MKKAKSVFSLSIIIFCVFILGLLSGFFIQMRIDNSKNKQNTAIIENLSSGAITVVIYGLVDSIDESKSITINNNGEIVEIPISDNVQVYSYQTSNQQQISLSDISLQTNVSIMATLDSGKLMANTIIIAN